MSVSHKSCLNNNNVGWPFIWITCLDSEAYTEPSSTCDAHVPGCPGAFILSSLLSRHTSLTINTVILLPTCLYCVCACVLHLLCFFQCACVKMYAFFSLSLPQPLWFEHVCTYIYIYIYMPAYKKFNAHYRLSSIPHREILYRALLLYS